MIGEFWLYDLTCAVLLLTQHNNDNDTIRKTHNNWKQMELSFVIFANPQKPPKVRQGSAIETDDQ